MQIAALDLGIKLDDKAAIAGLQGVDRAGKTATASLNLGIKQAAQALTALGLEAKIVAVNGVDRITVSAKNLDQANLILGKMGRGLSAVATEALRAAKATDQIAVAAQRVETVAVRANANVAAASGVSARKYSTAALQISGTLAAISQAGDASANHIARLISLGSGIAFAFGPAGQIVGAIGTTTVAIFNMFDRARKEMEATRIKFKEEVDKMQDVGDRAGLMDEGSRIFKGTASKNFADGLKNMRNELIELAKAPSIAEALGALPGARENLAKMEALGGEPWAAAMQRLARERVKELESNLGPRVRALLDLIKTAEEQLAKVQKALLNLPSKSTYEAPAIVTSGSSTDAIAAGITRTRTAPSPGMAGMAGLVIPGAPDAAAGFGGAAASVRANIEKSLAEMEAVFAEAQAPFSAAVDRFAAGIGDAIHQGFARAFSGEGISGLLKGFTSGIVGSLGGMFVELGKHLIQFGTIMEALKKGLTTLFGSGGAAIFAGVALIALGSLMGAGANILSGGGGGGAGVGAAAPRSLGDRLATHPISLSTVDMNGVSPVPPRVYNITVIGPDDPKAQRDIKRLIRNADERGL